MSINKVVYKYPIDIDSEVTLPGGKVVHTEASEIGKLHEIRVWVEHWVDEHGKVLSYNGQSKLVLKVHGTGHLVDLSSEHVGTVLAGPFVWHIYKVN